MRKSLTVLAGCFLVIYPALCGLVGYVPIGGLLGQSDTVVVATVRNSTVAGKTLTLDLIVTRSLKGRANAGAELAATLSSPNVTDGSGAGLNMNGSISANSLLGKTGLWFLRQSGTGWIVLPLMTGDMFTDGLYLPIPSSNLPSAFTYETSAPSKTKLIQEIGAAAQDATTAAAISRLEAMRVFVDLGSDLQPIFGQLTSSPRVETRTMGLAGEIRLGTPGALNAVVSSNLTTFPPNAQSQLANAVCEYRNADVSGVAALGILLNPQYSGTMRACAVYALREIHSPETLPLLESLLEDSSVPIRYDAVIGTAQFAIGFPIARMEDKKAAIADFKTGPNFTSDMYPHYPAQGLFVTNEQDYISYWKTWLAAHPTK